MTAQQEFDETYISSTEICQELGISRATVAMGRRRGILPDAVEVLRPDGAAHVTLWKRAVVRPHLDKWKESLAQRRGEPA